MIVFGSKYMKKHSHYHDPGINPGKVTAAVLDSDATFSTRSSKTAPDWQRQRLLMKSIAVSRFKIISFLPLCGCKSVTAIVWWIKMTHHTIRTEKQWAVMTHCR